MADQAVVHIGENSPEEVAYKLMRILALNEGKSLQGGSGSTPAADRKWVLDTYAECIIAVRSPHGRVG